MDHILGNKSEGRSTMVGFRNNLPKQAHHRGASVPMTSANEAFSCPKSFVKPKSTVAYEGFVAVTMDDRREFGKRRGMPLTTTKREREGKNPTMANKAMEAMKDLDLKRYMGRWYEIACFPSRFQPRDGVNTRATYSVRDDGTVNVLNETWSAGKRSYIEGIAYKAYPNSDEAKLKVKFYVPPFLPIIPVVGDYWVLYIDHDYQYALIGQPSRNYLWVLCRKTHLEDEIYKELVEKAKDCGYDVSKLIKTPHSDPPPEEEGPQDTKGIWWIKSLLGK